MTLSRRSLHSTLPALFAMLMLVIGPLLSQAVSLSHVSSSGVLPSSAPCHGAMPAEMGMHGGHGAGADAHPGGHEHAIWAKCGYCELLLTCPGVSGFGYVAIIAPAHGVVRLVLPVGRQERVSPVFPGARTRAPPIVV